MNRKGIICAGERQYRLAVEYFEMTLEIVDNMVGADHHFFAEILENIGLVHVATGEYETALQQFWQAREIKSRALPPHDRRLGVSARLIGELYTKVGNLPEAIIHYHVALRIYSANVGTEQCVIELLEDLGVLYHSIGNPAQAVRVYDKALHTRIRANAPSPGTGDLLNNFAVSLAASGRHALALNALQMAQIMYEKDGIQDPDSLSTTLRNIGVVSSELGHFSTAIRNLSYALNIQLNAFAGRNPKTTKTLGDLGAVFGRIGDHRAAVRLYEVALALNQWQLSCGFGHVSVDQIRHGWAISTSELRKRRPAIRMKLIRGMDNWRQINKWGVSKKSKHRVHRVEVANLKGRLRKISLSSIV